MLPVWNRLKIVEENCEKKKRKNQEKIQKIQKKNNKFASFAREKNIIRVFERKSFYFICVFLRNFVTKLFLLFEIAVIQ